MAGHALMTRGIVQAALAGLLLTATAATGWAQDDGRRPASLRLFYVHNGVGSEEWTDNGFTRGS